MTSHLQNRSSCLLAVLLFAATVLTGCIHRPGGIAASTTPINGRQYHNLGRVRATDSHIALFGIIPLKGANWTSAAVDAAISKRNADALINVTVDCYDQYWIIFSRSAIMVEGEAIKFIN